MGARTLLFLIAIAVAAAFLLGVVSANSTVVTVTLPLFRPLQAELWKVMLGGVGIGAASALAFDAAGRVRRSLRERRRRRGREQIEEGERLFLEGVGEMASGRWAEALLCFEAAQEYAGADVRLLTRKAECLTRLDRPAEAAAALQEAAEEDRSDRGVAYAQAEALAATGEKERARALLERTIPEDPEPPTAALASLRDLQREAGEIRAALATQQQILSLAAPSEQPAEIRRALALRHAHGRMLLEEGETAEAVRVFRGIVEEDPEAVPAWVRLGEAYLSGGNEKSAIEVWERAFEATGATAPLTALQNLHLDRTRPEEAIALWKRAISRTNGGAAAQYLLGRLYDQLFMLDDALRVFSDLPRFSSPALAARLSRILEGRGELPQAVARAREVLAAVPALAAEYSCSGCGARYPEWADTCRACDAYGSVRLDLGAPDGEGGNAEVPKPVSEPVPAAEPA